MSQTTIRTETLELSPASTIPRQRTVERPWATEVVAAPRVPEQAVLPARRPALRRLGALLRRPAPSAEQVERAAAAAAWARQRPFDAHHVPLLAFRALR
jgi:hypothetical protein